MKTRGGRRILGYCIIAVGGAAILIGASPLFPVFLEAFLVGGLLIATGLWLLAGPELRESLRKAASSKAASGKAAPGATAARGAVHQTRRSPAPRVVIDPLLPVRILRLAKDHGGILTVAEVAMSLSIPLDQSEAGLAECVRAGNALPDFDIARGHAYYRFPEFITDDDGAEGR